MAINKMLDVVPLAPKLNSLFTEIPHFYTPGALGKTDFRDNVIIQWIDL